MRLLEMDATRQRAFNPRMVDGVLLAVGVLLTALAVKTPWSTMPGWVIASAGMTGSAAVWWRRSAPLSVTLVAGVAHILSGNPWPLLVGLYTSGYALEYRRLLPVLAAGTAGFVGLEWIEIGAVGVNGLAAAVAQTVGALAVGGYAGTRGQLIVSLRERAERAETEREMRIEQARAAERARIAREMHDVLAHKIALIALQSGALEVSPTADPTKVHDGAALIGTTAREASDELRSILGVLNAGDERGDPSSMGDQFGDVHSLVSTWRAAGADVELRDEVGVFPAPLQRPVYRLIQEGLANAIKHAPGAPIVVTVAGRAGYSLVVTVSNGAPGDDGLSELSGAGTGLVALEERLRLLGGTLKSGPVESGWRLEGRLPWVEADDREAETEPSVSGFL
jgi:signal transduction histidine kinase